MAGTQALTGGNFYGAVQRQQTLHDAIFTDLRHVCGRKLPAHSHGLPFFGLLLNGHYGECYRHQEKQFGPFNVMYRPAGIPHQDEIAPGGLRFFEIEILPAWQQRLRDCAANLETPCDDCHGGPVFWLAMALFRETRGCMSADLSVESLLAELLGAAARMPAERAKQAPRWLDRVIEQLRTQYCERLTLEELGDEAGVHSVHLSRVFRRFMGQGIGDYVHRLRVREACERMLEPGIALADIGIAVGFADQSHFTRAFKKVTGMSPAAFRTLVSREPAALPAVTRPPATNDYRVLIPV